MTRRESDGEFAALRIWSPSFALSLWGLLTFTALICQHARGIEPMPSRAYEVTIETGMPHLEENLRYGITPYRTWTTGTAQWPRTTGLG